MRRILFALALMALLLPLASAKDITKHTITITLSDNSSAVVSEEYLLDMNVTDTHQFEALSLVSQNDISVWTSFLSSLKVSMSENYTNLMITAEKNIQYGSKLKLAYYIPALGNTSEEARTVTRTITGEAFIYYNALSNQLEFPARTNLNVKISLAKSTDITAISPTPDSESIEGGQITHSCIQGGYASYLWNGPFVTSDFKIIYATEKTISESFGLQGIVGGIYYAFLNNPLYGLVLVILVSLAVIYRKSIFSVVIDSFAGEEEVERPKKELK